MIPFKRLPGEISALSKSVSSVKYFFSVRIPFYGLPEIVVLKDSILQGAWRLPASHRFPLVKIPFLGLPS